MTGVRVIRTLALAVPLGLAAQRNDGRIAQGDSLYAARDVSGALAKYEAVLKDAPGEYDALRKAARASTDLGEFEPSTSVRSEHFSRARQYAERAVKANGSGAEGQFELARALGRTALAAGIKERVRLATEVRAHALGALSHDPRHAGAMDVLGMWNAEVMRLSGLERAFAKAFLGGKVLGEANWGAAARYLEQAVALEPDRIVHHLDLAGVYRDVGKTGAARAQYTWILNAPLTEFNDANYRKQAADALRGLK